MFLENQAVTTFGIIATIAAYFVYGRPASAFAAAAPPGQQLASQTAPAKARQLGTIKAIHGTTITLTTEAGKDIAVLVGETTRMVWVEPGQKDLKAAVGCH